MNTDTVSEPRPCPPIADTHAKRLQWWMQLEPQWRAAFGFAFFNHANQPLADELENLWQTSILRFAGPRAPYPNMNFELTNCSGLKGLSNVEILVLTNHRIDSISELTDMLRLKSLFVNNNNIQRLDGVESLINLEQLYAQINNIDSIEPIQTLKHLKEVYVSLTNLRNLNGLTRKQAASLKQFYCLPNDNLTNKEIMRVERNLGIRCRSL